MPAKPPPDAASRLLRNSRREALIVGIVWLLALVWSVAGCYLLGYEHPPDSWIVRSGLAQLRTPANFRQILGLPDWVLFAIIIPWLLCTAFTIWFSLFGIADDDLGTEAEEGAGHGH